MPHVAASETWSAGLAAWGIPAWILEQAPTSPWIHPPAMFDVPEHIPDSPSHTAAREVSPRSVIDVGCGGGIAAFAVAPPAIVAIGVDHQQAMLDMFERNAAERGVAAATHLGFWPDVSAHVGAADVVTCHHVAYNVADITPFLTALTEHAHRRVVLEVPARHPLTTLGPAWRHFWDLERPEGPTAEDLEAVARELGYPVHAARWTSPLGRQLPFAEQVAVVRTRLCLPADRDHEVADFLTANPMPESRDLAALWWDV